MCLTFDKMPVLHTAQEDIVVYKGFKKAAILSKYFMWAPIKSKLYCRFRKIKPVYIQAIYTDDTRPFWDVFEGYYSLPSLGEAQVYFNTRDVIIKKCIIPKGTTYFQTGGPYTISQIASSMIIIDWDETYEL